MSAAEGRLLVDLARIVGDDGLLVEIPDRYTHDETLGLDPVVPLAVVQPRTELEVAEIVATCRDHGTPIVPRGGGTGLSGGAQPIAHGIVLSFERMARLLDMDPTAGTARVEPGITLLALDEELAATGLCYPVYPGELSSTVGGNVATNAGGMRAVRWGTTRQNVLGLRFVTGTAQVVHSGGAIAKYSSGYDLTQLIIGSEGTLGLVTEAIVRLRPRPRATTLLLTAWESVAALPDALASLIAQGLEPGLCEYVDATALAALAEATGLTLGIPPTVAARATGYLAVELDASDEDVCAQLTAHAATALTNAGALEVFPLSSGHAASFVAARERAFWTVKALGARDILDMVVPRSRLTDLLQAAKDLEAHTRSVVAGTGHIGDGNVHFSIFADDADTSGRIANQLVAQAIALGGAVSGEHGIGVAKRAALLAHENPTRIALQRAIKQVFDPDGILNPGKGPS